MEKFDALQHYFGYESFREGQECLVDAVLSGQDALGIMPTGGGKSLCYQLPAILLDGITIVISPLISLMKDQVDSLTEMGIPATFINSSLSDEEFRERVRNLHQHHYKLVYVAPERLNSHHLTSLINHIDIDLIAVDEAHCIAKWGHDFRPSYSAIPHFINRFDKRPVVAAYTATATTNVIEEIKYLLDLQQPQESIVGFDRPNLSYEVLKVGNKQRYIESFINDHYADQSGIIYCATRKAVEGISDALASRGFSVAPYHGGMSAEARDHNQHQFILDNIKIIVATNAFGMGIDKPNVRFVIHYNMPQNMEAYYQEAGRAGRDGDPAHCILFYSPSDIVQQKFFIGNEEFGVDEERKKMLYQNLQYLIDYCHTDQCLRAQILKYFDETPKTEKCDNCGNCTNVSSQVEITTEAQKILSCIYRVGQAYGINMIILVLRGSKDRRILNAKLDEVSTYGIMKEFSDKSIREMIMTLIARGYIFQTIDERPILRLVEKSRELLRGEVKIYHRQDLINHRPQRRAIPSQAEEFPDYDRDLFEALRQLRLEIAKERSLPAFVIFNDATLKEMAYRKPDNKNMMLTVKGVGVKKFEQYGEQFIGVIEGHIPE